ncbi:MAG: ATP synthase F1 subunit epsilon [Clostridia bacterium]|nr:ATP synthase F1 subunit epsilon [Clostridia bacterium]
MASFSLKIVTCDGLIFDGQAEKLIVRTTAGDMAVLARHINCVCALGMGRAVVVIDGQRRTAACIGGMLEVLNGEVTLVPTTFEWAEDIDVARAEASLERAKHVLEDNKEDAVRIAKAKAKINRALVRRSVAGEVQK